MQETSESVLKRAEELISGMDSNILTRLCSEIQGTRTNAVNCILSQLHPKENPNDNNVLQALPIAFLSLGDHMGSLFFLEACIRNGAFFDPGVINAVIDAVARFRIECTRENDTEALQAIKHILHKFYGVILENPQYQKIPEIYLSIGTDQERDNNKLGAIGLYNEALGKGSLEAYISLGTVYESQGNYTMSETIFDIAYQISGEERFLHRYIHALCKSGKREDAYTYYLYLQNKSTDTINPFIVYLDDIQNDHDLREFESLMTEYHMESTFEPNESLQRLTHHASIYIGNEIEKESSIIEKLNLVPIETWTVEQDSAYIDAIKRRLYLMQTHIITLQDPRYLDFYLDETKQYTVEGNERLQHMMRDYFANSFSLYTYASYRQISGDESSRMEDMELFESMRIHLVQIAAIFSQHSFHETIRDKITPFVDECMRIEGILDDDDLELPDEDVQILKKDSQLYESFSSPIKELYETFIQNLDKKYGMFYRRSIQLLVRDEQAIPITLKKAYEEELKRNGGDHIQARETVISNMRVFLEYPDIALLFFLEKIILGQDLLSEEQTMESFVLKYNLDSLISPDTLLFAGILYEGREFDTALEYIMNVPGILDIPQILSMIAEHIRYMDDEENQEKILGELDTIYQVEYDAKSFFHYVLKLAEKIFRSDNPSDKDISYMLMAHANIKTIQEGDIKEIILEFQKAGEYGLPQGYISAGDIFEELGDYDSAIESFNTAYLMSPDTISIRRLLEVLLNASQFDMAWKYIETAIRDGYDISGYISAWYLYQGKEKEAMIELCKIIQSNGMIDLILPDGYMEILAGSIQKILDSSDVSLDLANTKILASYLNASLSYNNEDSDPENYIKHIAYIGELMDEFESKDIIVALLEYLLPLTGKIDFNDDISPTDRLIGYLHLHLTKIHVILVRYHKDNQKNRDTEATQKTFNLINALNISSITLLQRFPDSEKYLEIWRNAMNFVPTIEILNKKIHPMSATIQ